MKWMGVGLIVLSALSSAGLVGCSFSVCTIAIGPYGTVAWGIGSLTAVAIGIPLYIVGGDHVRDTIALSPSGLAFRF